MFSVSKRNSVSSMRHFQYAHTMAMQHMSFNGRYVNTFTSISVGSTCKGIEFW